MKNIFIYIFLLYNLLRITVENYIRTLYYRIKTHSEIYFIRHERLRLLKEALSKEKIDFENYDITILWSAAKYKKYENYLCDIYSTKMIISTAEELIAHYVPEIYKYLSALILKSQMPIFDRIYSQLSEMQKNKSSDFSKEYITNILTNTLIKYIGYIAQNIHSPGELVEIIHNEITLIVLQLRTAGIPMTKFDY